MRAGGIRAKHIGRCSRAAGRLPRSCFVTKQTSGPMTPRQTPVRAMLTLLFKFVLFLLGVVAILDGALPTTEQAMQVDGHSSSQGRRSHDTDYRLDLVGGNTDSCDVGFQAYQSLHDGDRVTVVTSTLFKQCASIVTNS